MRAAVFTVSPKSRNRGSFLPTTPAESARARKEILAFLTTCNERPGVDAHLEDDSMVTLISKLEAVELFKYLAPGLR